jgi:hypothetical protein
MFETGFYCLSVGFGERAETFYVAHMNYLTFYQEFLRRKRRPPIVIHTIELDEEEFNEFCELLPQSAIYDNR